MGKPGEDAVEVATAVGEAEVVVVAVDADDGVGVDDPVVPPPQAASKSERTRPTSRKALRGKELRDSMRNLLSKCVLRSEGIHRIAGYPRDLTIITYTGNTFEKIKGSLRPGAVHRQRPAPLSGWYVSDYGNAFSWL